MLVSASQSDKVSWPLQKVIQSKVGPRNPHHGEIIAKEEGHLENLQNDIYRLHAVDSKHTWFQLWMVLPSQMQRVEIEG